MRCRAPGGIEGVERLSFRIDSDIPCRRKRRCSPSQTGVPPTAYPSERSCSSRDTVRSRRASPSSNRRRSDAFARPSSVWRSSVRRSLRVKANKRQMSRGFPVVALDFKSGPYNLSNPCRLLLAVHDTLILDRHTQFGHDYTHIGSHAVPSVDPEKSRGCAVHQDAATRPPCALRPT